MLLFVWSLPIQIVAYFAQWNNIQATCWIEKAQQNDKESKRKRAKDRCKRAKDTCMIAKDTCIIKTNGCYFVMNQYKR
jgi:hypothetical protein